MKEDLVIVLINLICLSFNVTHTTGKMLPTVPNNTEIVSISKCITVINDKKLYKPTIVILKNNTEKFIEEEVFVRSMIKIFEYHNIPLVVLEDLDYLVDSNDLREGNLMVIIYFDSCKALSTLDTIAYDIKYLVITPPCRKLVSIIDKFQTYDVTIVVKKRGGKYKFLTIVPKIDADTCELRRGLKPKFINTCYAGRLEKTKVFPNKYPQNLKGCTFKVGLNNLFPFAAIKNAHSLRFMEPIETVKGMDIEIMKIVAKKLNVTLKFYYVYKTNTDPRYFTFFDLLINGTLDACAGGLFRAFQDDVSYSGLYNRQNIMWIYSAEREERCWNNFIRKLDEIYVFFIVHICYSLIWNIVCIYDGHSVSLKNTLLYSWGALVSATSLPKARSAKQKILTLSYLCLSIYMAFYFNTKLFYYITVQDPPDIFKTNEDIMRSGRPVFLKFVDSYIEDEKLNAFANTSEICYTIQECEAKAKVNKGVTLLKQGDFYALQSLTITKNDVTMLRTVDNILTISSEIVLRKNSPVLKRFQNIITSIFESGITESLFQNAVGLTVIDRVKIAEKTIVTNGYICKTGCLITLHQIAGLFYFWFLGCGLSCCVFLVEVTMSNKMYLCNKN